MGGGEDNTDSSIYHVSGLPMVRQSGGVVEEMGEATKVMAEALCKKQMYFQTNKSGFCGETCTVH